MTGGTLFGRTSFNFAARIVGLGEPRVAKLLVGTIFPHRTKRLRHSLRQRLVASVERQRIARVGPFDVLHHMLIAI